MTLYQIETVKVPITDTNTEADSYTETAITKPIWLQIKNITYSWYSLN